MLEIGGFGERANDYAWPLACVDETLQTGNAIDTSAEEELAEHLGDHALLQALSRHENPSRVMFSKRDARIHPDGFDNALLHVQEKSEGAIKALSVRGRVPRADASLLTSS